MKAEIISIGDEILIGQINNTNSVWIAQQLTLIGIQVLHMSTVSDEESAIVQAFDQALLRSQLVFITGGLGPTKDDLTKKTFANYFKVPLVLNEEVLDVVHSFFTKRGRELTEVNRQQALVPEGCEVIMNYKGTAPGMWMKKNSSVFISMPGVPYEMKAMMTDIILPKIKAEFQLPSIYHKTILTNGIGESALAELIEDWENRISEEGLKLAYLPQPGMVRLRLSAFGESMEELKSQVNKHIQSLQTLIPDYIFGIENYGEEPLSLQHVVFNLLLSRKETVSVAESCTGGYLASLITSVPGASEVFSGGLVPYSNQSKHQLLGIDQALFDTVGAVSKDCVVALAKNVRDKFNSTYGIGISGIAGPGGGTADKPVGLVWIAVANAHKVIPIQLQFGDIRQNNIVMSANAALNLLRKFILKQP